MSSRAFASVYGYVHQTDQDMMTNLQLLLFHHSCSQVTSLVKTDALGDKIATVSWATPALSKIDTAVSPLWSLQVNNVTEIQNSHSIPWFVCYHICNGFPGDQSFSKTHLNKILWFLISQPVMTTINTSKFPWVNDNYWEPIMHFSMEAMIRSYHIDHKCLDHWYWGKNCHAKGGELTLSMHHDMSTHYTAVKWWWSVNFSSLTIAKPQCMPNHTHISISVS